MELGWAPKRALLAQMKLFPSLRSRHQNASNALSRQPRRLNRRMCILISIQHLTIGRHIVANRTEAKNIHEVHYSYGAATLQTIKCHAEFFSPQ